jgi:molecular chaperone Hsp33
LSGERLLFRLFHERGVKVFRERALDEFCRCSTERIERLLKSFTPDERADMVGDDGRIGVTCEFCATQRHFDPADFN